MAKRKNHKKTGKGSGGKTYGGYTRADVEKIKKDPVKYFQFLYPNLTLNSEQKKMIEQLASDKSRAIAHQGSKNLFVQFAAKFIASNYG